MASPAEFASAAAILNAIDPNAKSFVYKERMYYRDTNGEIWRQVIGGCVFVGSSIEDCINDDSDDGDNSDYDIEYDSEDDSEDDE
jgi:hypothetical protein